MNKHSIGTFLVSLSMTWCGLAKDTAAIEPLIQDIERVLAPTNMRAEYLFENTRSNGTKTKYRTAILAASSDLIHVTFLEPAREKGREVLRLKDQIWTFLKSVGRTIKIQDRESFAGGDFSNADVLRIDWTKQYQAVLRADTGKQLVIDLNAKTKEASYAKMRLWIKKSTRLPVQQHFFDSENNLLKTLKYGNVQTLGGVTRPMRLVMKNVISKQHSELNVLSLKIGPKIPQTRFMVNQLGK